MICLNHRQPNLQQTHISSLNRVELSSKQLLHRSRSVSHSSIRVARMEETERYDIPSVSTRTLLLALSGVLLIVGSIAPWASVTAGLASVSISGMHGGGRITIVLGIVMLVIAAMSWSGNSDPRVTIVFVSLGAGGIGIFNWTDVQRVSGDLAKQVTVVSAKVEWGLYLIVGGAVVGLMAGIMDSPVAGSLSEGKSIASSTHLSQQPTRGQVESGTSSFAAPCPLCGQGVLAHVLACPRCGGLIGLPRLLRGTSEAWVSDPSGRYALRWWDGVDWTTWVRKAADSKVYQDPPFIASQR
jgi:hypothetical protein